MSVKEFGKSGFICRSYAEVMTKNRSGCFILKHGVTHHNSSQKAEGQDQGLGLD